MSEIPREPEVESEGSPSEEALSSKQPVTQSQLPAQENRIQELRRVFSDFEVTKKNDKGGQETVSFSSKEVESIIANTGIMRRHLPESIQSSLAIRFIENTDNLNIPISSWKGALLRFPHLFVLKPETINQNAESSSELLGVKKEEFIKAALKHPSLFAFKPETLNQNAESSSQMLGIEKGKFIELALKQSQLLFQKPETLNLNVEQSAEKLGVKKEEFIKAALKQSSLFYQDPKKTENIYNLYKNILPSIKPEILVKYPSLLCYSPERILSQYVISKMGHSELIRPSDLTKNPLTFAEEKLSLENMKLFRPAYEYLTALSNKMRKRSRIRGEETKIYEQMTEFVEKFFGKKDELLTKEKIKEFREFISKHIKI